jgi:AraC-like DNA-binding protein
MRSCSIEHALAHARVLSTCFVDACRRRNKRLNEPMPFVCRKPVPRLSDLLLCYWQLDGMTAGQTYAAAPKRHLELVVNVGAPQLAGYSRDAIQSSYAACWLTVHRERPLYLVPTGPSLLFGVRFRDFALPPWLAGAAGETTRSIDLSDAPVTAALVGEISRCRGIEAAAAAFDRFFLARAGRSGAVSGLAGAVRRCDLQDRLRPSEIIREAADEPRRVRVLAKQASGISIRRFARLARLDRALVHLARESGDRIADVAQAAGYYDEAHMAHDFATLCGTSPARYRRARPAGSRLPHHLYLC